MFCVRTPQELPYAVGDRVRIRTASGSKGAGTEGIVVKITTQMTRLDSGYSTKHEWIEPVFINTAPPEDSPDLAAGPKTRAKNTEDQPNELLKQVKENKVTIDELRRDMSDMKITLNHKLNEIIDILD